MTPEPIDLGVILTWPATTHTHQPATPTPPAVDAFPVLRDPALEGYIDVTPETGGIPDDRVAQVLYLRGLADQIELSMTDMERAELAQYDRPGLPEVA